MGEILIVIAVGLVLLMLVIAASWAKSITRFVTRSFYCATAGRDVTVEFVEATSDGQPIAVTRCSAFGSAAPTCGVPCLHVEPVRHTH